MGLEVVLLRDVGACAELPGEAELTAWTETALAVAGEDLPETCTVTVRVIDEPESARLNERFRGRAGATNVLSFPSGLPTAVLAQLPARPLGDLAICAPLVAREADEQGKSRRDHWAHLVVHGCLHLLGYDHQEAAEAARMEALEIDILAAHGIPDPYA
jgi:probable rRNA maturation factor